MKTFYTTTFPLIGYNRDENARTCYSMNFNFVLHTFWWPSTTHVCDNVLLVTRGVSRCFYRRRRRRLESFNFLSFLGGGGWKIFNICFVSRRRRLKNFQYLFCFSAGAAEKFSIFVLLSAVAAGKIQFLSGSQRRRLKFFDVFFQKFS